MQTNQLSTIRPISRARRAIHRLALASTGVLFFSPGCAEPPSGAPEDDQVDSVSSPLAAAAANLFIVGSIKDNSGAPVPGVSVAVAGIARNPSIANAAGIYRFSNVPAGTFQVTPMKAGATFAPSSATFTLTNNSIEASFRCLSGCEGIDVVAPLKELTIVDPSVTTDARASNAVSGAPWSFRFMMEQMTPAGVDPADFVTKWIDGFRATAGPINGFPVDTRAVDTNLIGVWPKRVDGKIDLARSPFKLLAIVNRADLHEIGDGEGRFIYGMIDQGGNGQSFTVIFEFRLPITDATTKAGLSRLSWLTQFHALRDVAFGPTFNAKLQAITDKFTRRGTTAGNPNGSSISQVRTNEIQFGGPWQLREFHLIRNAAGQGLLQLSPTAQTPDPGQNNTPALANYVTSNRFHIIGGLASVPNSLIGGQSNEIVPWSFSNFPSIDEEARHSFAGQTCNGCHNGEAAQIDGFYHVTPRIPGGVDGTAAVSDFVKTNEFPRRQRFMQNRLRCKADLSDCSSGAEPLL